MDFTLTTQACAWFVDSDAVTDDSLEEYRAWLGADELRRYSRFVRPERQRQFVLGRVLLRQCLGAVLAVPARDIRLVERPGQAPGLAWPDSPRPGFSISHSGHWVACAVSASTALGFDIERIDTTRDIGALSAQAFDREQQAWLAARPASNRVRDFYQMWSQAEARIKLGGPAAYETALHHPAFAAALCSAQPLSEPPELQMVILRPD
jgi:4'-phosphopantetheinyl transferase